MIMPAALLILTLVAMLAGTVTSVATYALRGSRESEQRRQVQWLLEESVALAMHDASLRSLTERPVGWVEAIEVQTAHGIRVRVERMRTHPLVVRVTAELRGVHQSVWLWLAGPPLPLIETVAQISPRDTLSVLARAARSIESRARAMPTSAPVSASQSRLFLGAVDTFLTETSGEFTGMAILDGDLAVRRDLVLRGLLILHGQLACQGGVWAVHGAAIMVGNTSPTIPPCLQLRGDRRATETALALVATPRRGPFHLRHFRAISAE